MKTITFKKDSYHYKLAELWSDYPSSDICSYMRQVFFGIIKFIWIMIASICITTFASGLIVHTALSIGFSLYYDTNLFTETGIAGTLIFGGAILVALCIYTIDMYKDYVNENQYKKSNNFISVSYNSFKHKFCAKIEFQ